MADLQLPELVGAGSSVTLRDVALLAGVSEATASRVLTNSRRVGPGPRERVLRAATKLSYQPNPHARALARARDTSVGVVVHDITDPYFSEIVRGVLSKAEAAEQMVLICNTYRDPERELSYIRQFRAQRVAALVFAGSGRIDRTVSARITTEIYHFERAGGRAVLVGRHLARGDAVIPENVDGARQMGRHLFERGHRHIGVIAGPAGLTTTQDRLRGLTDQLASLGVTLADDHVVSGDFGRRGGEKAAHKLLRSFPELTAIFALNDVMAIGALAAARDEGLCVPVDISVAGFDDIPVVQDLTPSLSTVRVPLSRMGERALALALSPSTDGFRAERFPTELVVRGSTGPVPLPRGGR